MADGGYTTSASSMCCQRSRVASRAGDRKARFTESSSPATASWRTHHVTLACSRPWSKKGSWGTSRRVRRTPITPRSAATASSESSQGASWTQVFDGAMGEYVARALQVALSRAWKKLDELEAMIAEAKERAPERDDEKGGK